MFLFVFFTAIISVVSFVYVVYYVIGNNFGSRKLILIFTLIVSLLFCVLCIILDRADYMIENVSRENTDYSKIGAFGDFIGGILNPFIAFMGIIGAGFAFYMQYQANKQVQDQFKIQKFESQFYEMLRLYKENINEMKIDGYEYILIKGTKKGEKVKLNRLTEGRKVFVTMNAELKCIYVIVKKVYSKYHKSTYTIEDNRFIKELFSIAYQIFFHGVKKYCELTVLRWDTFLKDYQDTGVIKTEDKEFVNSILLIVGGKDLIIQKEIPIKIIDKRIKSFIKKLYKELVRIKNLHKNGVTSVSTSDPKRLNNYIKSENIDLKLYFNYKPFNGHQTRLGHYYRHLIALVDLTVKQTNISYEDKREYLKILRAQFSVFELSLLFYNFYAGYGNKWENEINSYFIDYRILHNIETDRELTDFDPVELLRAMKVNFLYKQGNSEADPLFEIYGGTSELSEMENRVQKRL